MVRVDLLRRRNSHDVVMFVLAPASDLLNSTSALRNPPKELTLPLNGNKRQITRRDLVEYFGVERLGLDGEVIERELVLMRNDEAGLIQKLQKIEALFARPGTPGEGLAAGNARERIRERLRQLELVESPVEYRFSLRDPWSHALFTALARRYGLAPYRYRGQRRTTVMVKLTATFVDETLWPEFCQADAILRQYLNEVTLRVVAQAVSGDFADLEERPGTEATKSGAKAAGQRVMDLG